METAKTTTETRSRLIARILRDVLAAESFESLPDLLDALKFRLARLRVPWTNDECNDAMAWIATNRPLLVERREERRVEQIEPPPDLPRAAAKRRYDELLQGRPSPIRTMARVDLGETTEQEGEL